MRLIALLVILAGMPLAFGCSSREADPRTVQEAQKAYDDSLVALENGEYQRAAELLTVAIDNATLSADAYSDAMIKRAICCAKLGKFDEAHADLDEAERGAHEDQAHAARSFVYGKQGKSNESRAAMIRARKLNPAIEPFS